MVSGIEPFAIAVPEETLVDLKERLTRARLPGDFANDDWRYGFNQAYLEELIAYYRDEYDWREVEREMNAFSHFKTTIDGLPIHFIHERGNGPDPMPLIVTHGWPGTFWDIHKVIRPLTDPAAFGGSPEDAFDVVVPSLPGFGFSTPLTTPGIDWCVTADVWVQLMERLGYERFACAGGDWGAMVTQQLGHKYPDRVIGLHNQGPYPLSLGMVADQPDVPEGIAWDPAGNMPLPSEYAAEEAGWFERTCELWEEHTGYDAVQRTKPQTLAVALNDSVVGLCAWLLEKRHGWADNDGDIEACFSKSDLCTIATIYWVTQSAGTMGRWYWETARSAWTPSHGRFPVVEAPTSVAIYPHDIYLYPRRWAERYFNLQRWRVMPSGGHFPEMEVPNLVIEELRTFFRTLRHA